MFVRALRLFKVIVITILCFAAVGSLSYLVYACAKSRHFPTGVVENRTKDNEPDLLSMDVEPKGPTITPEQFEFAVEYRRSMGFSDDNPIVFNRRMSTLVDDIVAATHTSRLYKVPDLDRKYIIDLEWDDVWAPSIRKTPLEHFQFSQNVWGFPEECAVITISGHGGLLSDPLSNRRADYPHQHDRPNADPATRSSAPAQEKEEKSKIPSAYLGVDFRAEFSPESPDQLPFRVQAWSLPLIGQALTWTTSANSTGKRVTKADIENKEWWVKRSRKERQELAALSSLVGLSKRLKSDGTLEISACELDVHSEDHQSNARQFGSVWARLFPGRTIILYRVKVEWLESHLRVSFSSDTSNGVATEYRFEVQP